MKIKKIFSALSLFIASLLLCMFAVGCNFIDDGGETNNSPTGGGAESTYNDSSEQMGKIAFSTISANDRVLLSKADVYEKYSRSVVVITTELGVGSGVIVDVDNANFNEKVNDMYIITCHHVIDGAEDITVYVPDSSGRNYGDEDYNEEKYAFTGKLGGAVNLQSPIRLIGGDKQSDIAVLGLYVADSDIASDISRHKSKVMADSNKLRVGDDVIAIGNPTGLLPGTILDGVVSYIGRNATFSGIGTLSLIQTSVGITHGNSGGGLYNLYGELVGITNGGSESYTYCNYAIPLYVEGEDNTQGVIPIVKQLMGTSTNSNYGYVSGRWMLGVGVSETKGIGNTYLKIVSVEPYSPAAKAGVKAEDIILSIGYSGKTVNISDIDSLDTALADIRQSLTLGDKIELSLQRANRQYNLELTLSQYIYCNTGL